MSNFSYLVNASVFLSQREEPIVLDGMIKAISITSDYDRKVFPTIKLVMDLSSEAYYSIQQDNDVKFAITIKKTSQTQLENNITTLYSYFIKNKIFIPLDRDKTPINNESGLTAQNDQIPTLRAIFTLMSQEDLNNNKRLVNSVLMDTDMESAILYLANKFSDKPVIFERPDNQKLYKQIIFPPNNVIRSLKYLDTVYGIYNNGLRVFFDLNAYYIINKLDNKEVITVKGDAKDVFINVYGDNNSSPESLIYNDTKGEGEGEHFHSLKVHINDVRFVNYEDSKKEFIGTNNIIISQRDDDLNRNNYGEPNSLKTRVYYNRYDNAFKEKEMLNSGLKGMFMVATFDGLDIDAIACNHQFFVEFTNKNYKHYNGEYHIMKAESTFVIGDNSYSTLQSKLYFMKV
jgi:hypothetical protein